MPPAIPAINGVKIQTEVTSAIATKATNFKDQLRVSVS